MDSLFKTGWIAVITLLAHGATPLPPSVRTTVAGESYCLKLKSFTLPTAPGPLGLLLLVHINGGPPLRLLLDSGAQFLVLDKKTAAGSGLTGGAALDLVGAGGTMPIPALSARAETIDVGGLELRQVDVAIVNQRMADGIDGVFPLTLFGDFMVRLNVRAKSLELTPYSDQAGTGSRAISKRGLLFIKGTLNDSHEGYFLLDTGASYNAISSNLARRMNSSAALGQMKQLQSGTGRMEAPIVSEVLRFRVGKQELRADPVVAIDLSMASRYYDFEVSGLLGYPALRDSVVTINYREGLVQIERR